jgi:hypothetical protein
VQGAINKMVTTIILLICFSLAFISGGFIAFKGVQLGLRWQMETKQEQQPTLNTPIQPIIEKVEQKQAEKQEKEVNSIFNEWVNGAEESR